MKGDELIMLKLNPAKMWQIGAVVVSLAGVLITGKSEMMQRSVLKAELKEELLKELIKK